MKFKGQHYPVLIGVTHVPELNAIEVGGFGRFRAVGGRVAGRWLHQTYGQHLCAFMLPEQLWHTCMRTTAACTSLPSLLPGPFGPKPIASLTCAGGWLVPPGLHTRPRPSIHGQGVIFLSIYLTHVQVDDRGVHIGASVTLTRLMESFKQLSATLPTHQVRAPGKWAARVQLVLLWGCLAT